MAYGRLPERRPRSRRRDKVKLLKAIASAAAVGRGMERVARSTARRALDAARPAVRSFGTLSYGRPIVLEDHYGIRFVLYPWEADRRAQKLSRRFYRDEFAALRRLVFEGDVVFDVGANIGLHSTLFSRWVGEQGKVIAFEPVPETIQRLRETLCLNECTNVEVVEAGISTEVGSAQINVFEPQYADWNSFGSPRFGRIEPVGTRNVRVDTLDAFSEREGITHIDFLKLDVEGHEASAIRGGEGLLAGGRISALSFEISQVPLEGSEATSREIFDRLASFGYAAYRFNAKEDRFEGPIQDSDTYYENFYASRTDLTKEQRPARRTAAGGTDA